MTSNNNWDKGFDILHLKVILFYYKKVKEREEGNIRQDVPAFI